jgi:hypothetical protein
MLKLKSAIFDVADMDAELLACQLEVSVELARPVDFDVEDVTEGLTVDSFLFVGRTMGIDGAVLGFVVSGGYFVEKGIAQYSLWTKVFAGTVTAQSTTSPESASHFEVVLG